MIRSMTGFGQAEWLTKDFRIQAELKSVNHRYSEIAIRIPREGLVWEDQIKRMIQPHVKRGRVDVVITFERIGTAHRTIEVDWDLVEGYQDAAEQIRVRMNLPQSDRLTLQDVLRLPDLIVMKESSGVHYDAELEHGLMECVREATDRLLARRESEGIHLLQDITDRLEGLAQMQQNIVALAPLVAEEYRMKLLQRVKELRDERINFSGLQDENRITMEVALLAERTDIQEELTRLVSHFAQCRRLFLTDEPIGRKLDFYIQEMNREVNTIGSKANRIDIVNLVVDMKAELEKMREQVQNIE